MTCGPDLERRIVNVLFLCMARADVLANVQESIVANQLSVPLPFWPHFLKRTEINGAKPDPFLRTCQFIRPAIAGVPAKMSTGKTCIGPYYASVFWWGGQNFFFFNVLKLHSQGAKKDSPLAESLNEKADSSSTTRQNSPVKRSRECLYPSKQHVPHNTWSNI